MTAHEIQKHFVTHSPNTTEAAYNMLLSWISRIEDRQVAYRELCQALKEADLSLCISEVLNPSSKRNASPTASKYS